MDCFQLKKTNVQLTNEFWEPRPELFHLIKQYSILNDHQLFAYKCVRVIPNGYNEMLINLGTPASIENTITKKQTSFRVVLLGAYTQPFNIYTQKHTHIISIEFKHGGVNSLFNIPTSEITSQQINFETVDKFACKTLLQDILSEYDDNDKIKVLENYLISKLVTSQKTQTNAQIITQYIEKLNGMIEIETLSQVFNKSSRTILRIFDQEVGISPKEFCSLIRFNAVCKKCLSVEKINWQEIVKEFEFYDYSHLTKEFEKYIGIKPADFITKAIPNVNYSSKISLLYDTKDM